VYYVVFACSFDDSLVEKVQTPDLSSDWRSHPGPTALRLIGDQWFKESRSAVLQVPSAVIDSESNYLLNPEHRNFRRNTISEPQRFALDLRLLRQ
jgi:RES domain-containing protein